MSSNQNKTKEIKKMSSITKKLHNQLIRSRLGAFFAADFFFALLIAGTWVWQKEQDVVGGIDFDYRRNLTTRGEGLSNLTYVVTEGKEVILEEDATGIVLFISIVLIVVMTIQLLDVLFSYYGDHKRIKKTLSPINEMALKAEELSKMSFDESKFHTIENAIEHISPQQTEELSLGDNDLVGIEAAMNNMLKRMHDTYMQQARFVNDASHELRTPISVIQGYANMLDRWGKEDEEILDESITAIKNESDHMNHLVEQLLFLARGDAGRNTMNFENTVINDVMKEIYEESLMIDEKHIYKFDEKDQNVHVMADPSMIKQAMRILVDNAAKYTPEGEEIILSVGLENDSEAYIQVQDTGIGMEEVDVKHMFERFYRADDTRKVQGTGLGLSIARWIVEKHNGHFEILSRKELGTRIKILIKREN
ncbi:MAG: HAMP domain-containing histidine kinase [Eubacterium sp.]|nr:HAMP domain-containing histidine kinase [Eubacterium sp.]